MPRKRAAAPEPQTIYLVTAVGAHEATIKSWDAKAWLRECLDYRENTLDGGRDWVEVDGGASMISYHAIQRVTTDPPRGFHE